jgi:hypothetical protein
MRRLVFLLLAVLIPLKAWAGIAHPIALATSPAGTHVAVPHTGEPESRFDHHPAAAQDGCCLIDEPDSMLHLQECPHLTMPFFAAPPPLMGFDHTPTTRPVTKTARMRSVVLDVLLKPPLALH